MTKATVIHVDTCLPCYLQDHHNREGERLLAAPVDGGTRTWLVKESLRDEINAADLPTAEHYTAARAALATLFAGAHPFAVFDPYLDKASDDDRAEAVYAYFVLRW